MPDHRVTFDVTDAPTVGRFLVSDAKVRCVMGPFGSGKSSGCVMELLKRAREQRPQKDGIRRTRFAVVRNTYRELEDTTRKTFEQWIPGLLGHWEEQPFVFQMKAADIESEIMFRALDKPADVKKLLSLELTGAYVNELRELPKAILDGLTGRVGRYPAKKDGGASWRGVWADTNPWHTGHWASKLFKSNPKGYELYRQPSGLSDEAENLSNLPDDYYQDLCIGKDEEWIRVYVKGEEGNSDKGSIFGEQLGELERRGGVLEFHHQVDNIFVNLDLGLADSTALWFWRLRPHGVEVLDHYENHGKGLEHYFEQLELRAKDRGWQYLKIWLPHDAAQRTLAAGTSVLNRFLERYGEKKVAIGPNLTIKDGIDAGRWLLEQPGTRFHKRCDIIPEGRESSGLETLREYRFAWDDENRCFSKHPLHNWASHTGDSWRYVACVVKVSEMLARKDDVRPKAKPLQVADGRTVGTLDDAWAARGRSRGSRRIG